MKHLSTKHELGLLFVFTSDIWTTIVVEFSFKYLWSSNKLLFIFHAIMSKKLEKIKGCKDCTVPFHLDISRAVRCGSSCGEVQHDETSSSIALDGR